MLVVKDGPIQGVDELIGAALIAIKGYSAPEVERVYARARALCGEIEEAPDRHPDDSARGQ
jgi:hypothetical protein